jgi:4-amino-4-deoxychorismate lyase
MRREPGGSLIRKDAHLRRLRQSAAALGFSHDSRRIEKCLAGLATLHGDLRVRLVLHGNGACELSHAPFHPLEPGAVWRLVIAEARIDPDDALVRHKTTRRDIYEAARAEFPPALADEVILLNSDGMVCEGTITNVFMRGKDGILLTPPVAAGLLPGVLRGELLDQGRAREVSISPGDLASNEVLVGNSLRGLIPARLAEETA